MHPESTDSRDTTIGRVSVSERGGKVVSLKVDGSYGGCGSGITDEAFVQLSEYLDGKREVFDLDLEPDGTDFQKDVWNALMRIPYGKTVSYSDVAIASGHPGAVRAVGNAVGRNPIPVIIPCHRVIRADGHIGGYALGTELKIRLLKLEGALW